MYALFNAKTTCGGLFDSSSYDRCQYCKNRDGLVRRACFYCLLNYVVDRSIAPEDSSVSPLQKGSHEDFVSVVSFVYSDAELSQNFTFSGVTSTQSWLTSLSTALHSNVLHKKTPYAGIIREGVR